jgi:hypothetical protein
MGKCSQALVVHSYNPSYSGGWDCEDHSLRLAWANSSKDLISKLSEQKCAGGVAQAIEHLLCSAKFKFQTQALYAHMNNKIKK